MIRNGIHLGDARRICNHIPDNAIDLIATDPPYHKEHRHLYGWLGTEGMRIVKPGGFVAAMCGNYQLTECLMSLSAAGMHEYYVFQVRMNGSETGKVHPLGHHKPVITRLKHIAVFQVPGKRAGARAVLQNPLSMGATDKRHHPWGQDVDTYRMIVEAFSAPDELVLDPFAGGGTTAVACLKATDRHGASHPRRWICIDNDPDAVDTMQTRLSGRDLPMLAMLPEQQRMDLIS